MNQLNLIAVPNGAFTLKEALQDPLIKKLVKHIQSTEDTTTVKIKSFLAVYQMIDTLAQMRTQGMDMRQVNYAGLKESMKIAIELGYDTIMKTFTNHERKMLHELVKKASEH